jgi:enoyl-CoA hydratase/carnithine racemase
MMDDILIRIEGVAGRITLNRPAALNALTYDMVLLIDAALLAWADDPAVRLVLIDAEGRRAFCSGGDIADLYAAGRRGDQAYGRMFWRDEYRMNRRLAEYGKPVVSFLNGFVMGGGVGVGCHASHRIVGESAQIAMPECGIGLIPDVGGSALLARAPGRLGVYLGLTGARFGPADALFTGFADHFVPEAEWPALKAQLAETGEMATMAGQRLPEGGLALLKDEIDRLFGANSLVGIMEALVICDSSFATEALKALLRNSPLSMACTLALLDRLGPTPPIRQALAAEYRFTARASAQADFLEGVRAVIVEKDRTCRWRHRSAGEVTASEVEALLAPLAAGELTFEEY